MIIDRYEQKYANRMRWKTLQTTKNNKKVRKKREKYIEGRTLAVRSPASFSFRLHWIYYDIVYFTLYKYMKILKNTFASISAHAHILFVLYSFFFSISLGLFAIFKTSGVFIWFLAQIWMYNWLLHVHDWFKKKELEQKNARD